MPDYEAALLHCQAIREPQDDAEAFDLGASLFEIIDKRLQTAALLCSTYELACPASPGQSPANALLHT